MSSQKLISLFQPPCSWFIDTRWLICLMLGIIVVVVTSAEVEVLFFVCSSVIYSLSFCAKVMSWFHWNWCYDCAHQSEELINLVVSQSQIRMLDHFLFHFLHHCGTRDFMRDLLAVLIQSPADFHDTRRSDWRRQDNESTTSWQRSGRHSD